MTEKRDRKELEQRLEQARRLAKEPTDAVTPSSTGCFDP
jgi:hypothetical protein